MTASLMEMLFETLPFDGVEGAMHGRAHLEAASSADLAPYLRWIPRGETPPDVSAQPRASGDKENDQGEQLWSLRFSRDPAEVLEIDCAIRAHGFANVRVAESVRFGYEPPPGNGNANQIERNVLCTTIGGITVQLPLINEFLLQTWQTNAGLSSGTKKLWRFRTIHDTGIVRVFVYDFPFVGTALSGPYPVGTSSSPEELAELAKLERVCAKLGAASPEDDDGFGKELLADKLLAPVAQFDPSILAESVGDLLGGIARGDVAAIQAGQVARVLTGRVRVVVVCSVQCCRETNDFQPGSPAGVARIFPHVYACSNAPWIFKSFACTVQVNRPARSTQHLGCLEMNSEMAAFLVADTNRDARMTPTDVIPGWIGEIPKQIIPGSPFLPTLPAELDLAKLPPLPLWSNLFNYYVAKAEETLLNIPLHVVKRAATKARASSGEVVRRVPIPSPVPGASPDHVARNDKVTKLPHQGEFDNIHISPTMHLNRVDFLRRAGAGPIPIVTESVALRAARPGPDHLQEVGMAPLCTHDCFHVHWRWTDAGPDTPQQGWGGMGPSSVPGATMVPHEQDVWIWLRSGSELSYHAEHAVPPGETSTSWIPFFHHGAAILVELDSTLVEAARSGMALFEQASGASLMSKGERLNAQNSLSAFYWWNRYTIDTNLDVVELTEFVDLEAARKL